VLTKHYNDILGMTIENRSTEYIFKGGPGVAVCRKLKSIPSSQLDYYQPY
jgi:hypothetical protein